MEYGKDFFCGLLVFIFCHCEAQKLEIKYYPGLSNFTGTCTITCNDSTGIIQFDIFERYVPKFLLWIDRNRESNKILCSENEPISIEQINKVKDLYQKASCLETYHGTNISSDDIHIFGIFQNNTSYDKFELYQPAKGTPAYDFYKLSVEIMLETLKNKKSKGYVKCIGKYLR